MPRSTSSRASSTSRLSLPRYSRAHSTPRHALHPRSGNTHRRCPLVDGHSDQYIRCAITETDLNNLFAQLSRLEAHVMSLSLEVTKLRNRLEHEEAPKVVVLLVTHLEYH
jgi:hypothetical protein